jgi:hypothetical protein
MSIEKTASRLLKAYGEGIEFEYKTGGGFNPSTGVPLPAVLVKIKGHGYPGRYESNEIDGTVIKSGDIKLTVEKISQRPQVGWDVIVDGQKYRVQNVQHIRFSGRDVIYVCQIRR